MEQNNIEIRNSCGGDKNLDFHFMLNFLRNFLSFLTVGITFTSQSHWSLSFSFAIIAQLSILQCQSAHLILYCDCQQMPLQLDDVRLQ